MYKIIIDGKLMHDANLPNRKVIQPLLEPVQNDKGSFTFSLAKTHDYYSDIKPMKSQVYVYDESDIIFRGRVFEKDIDTFKTTKFYCEGEIAYLYDTEQPPFEFTGSVEAFFEQILTNHNAHVEDVKKFKKGIVTVTDPNDYIVRSAQDRQNTFKQLKEKLLDMLGGYLIARHESDGVYLDYLEDLTTLNSQKCELLKNIKSVEESQTYKDVFSVLYPYGAKNETTGLRLTIEDVNDGLPYLVNEEAVEKYGWIERTEYWDDVTISTNLKTKGAQFLVDGAMIDSSIDLQAVDQSNIKQDIRGFRMGSKIHAISKYHGLDAYFVPLKMSINLFNPSGNTITLNSTKRTLTDQNNNTDSKLDGILGDMEEVKNETDVNIPNRIEVVVQQLTSLVERTAELIRTEVKKSYYSKDDNQELISQMNTVFEQNAESFEMQFNQFKQDLDNVLNNTNASFEDIRKYIRFVDGNIILGQIENPFQLILTKERISFMQGAQEVAFVSNSTMYNRFLIVLERFQIGSFAFVIKEQSKNLAIKVV